MHMMYVFSGPQSGVFFSSVYPAAMRDGDRCGTRLDWPQGSAALSRRSTIRAATSWCTDDRGGDPNLHDPLADYFGLVDAGMDSHVDHVQCDQARYKLSQVALYLSVLSDRGSRTSFGSGRIDPEWSTAEQLRLPVQHKTLAGFSAG